MMKLIDWVLQNGGIAVCVCDADITRDNEERAKKLQETKMLYAKDERAFICDSMPSIEFWFLIHYMNTSKYFKDADQLLRFSGSSFPDMTRPAHFWRSNFGWPI